jgi:tRNA-2-methylthio-N6-dimethylallyladenosine synthase
MSENRLYIETYGCQMNFSDSEIVASIMTSEGYSLVNDPHQANLILINTCSIRGKLKKGFGKDLKSSKVRRN